MPRRERKKAQITRLTTELDHYRYENTQLGPYADFARDIRSRVIKRVGEMSEADIEAALVEEVAQAEAALLGSAIKARIDNLPAATILKLYAEHGSEEIQELLRQRAEIAKEFLAHNMHVERIRQHGSVYRSIDVTDTLPKDVVDFSLVYKSRGSALDETDLLKVRRLDRVGAKGKVPLFEVITKPTTHCDVFSGAHEVIEIGGAQIPGKNYLDTVVSLGTPLGVWPYYEEGSERHDESILSYGAVGGIAINGVDVLAHPPEAHLDSQLLS